MKYAINEQIYFDMSIERASEEWARVMIRDLYFDIAAKRYKRIVRAVCKQLDGINMKKCGRGRP